MERGKIEVDLYFSSLHGLYPVQISSRTSTTTTPDGAHSAHQQHEKHPGESEMPDYVRDAVGDTKAVDGDHSEHGEQDGEHSEHGEQDSEHSDTTQDSDSEVSEYAKWMDKHGRKEAGLEEEDSAETSPGEEEEGSGRDEGIL